MGGHLRSLAMVPAQSEFKTCYLVVLLTLGHRWGAGGNVIHTLVDPVYIPSSLFCANMMLQIYPCWSNIPSFLFVCKHDVINVPLLIQHSRQSSWECWIDATSLWKENGVAPRLMPEGRSKVVKQYGAGSFLGFLWFESCICVLSPKYYFWVFLRRN